MSFDVKSSISYVYMTSKCGQVIKIVLVYLSFFICGYWHTDTVNCLGCRVQQWRAQLAFGCVTVLACLFLVLVIVLSNSKGKKIQSGYWYTNKVSCLGSGVKHHRARLVFE